MMSWLRDLALDSFNSYDEEDDAELLTPTTMLSSTRGQPARASATAAATDTIPPLVRPIHPSKAKKQQPQHNGSNGNTPHQQEPDSPRTRRLLEQLPTLCPLGAHDAAVSAYLENIGMTEESIVWARLNVPELFDMDVGTALKPGYKRLFDLPSPPSALVCQLKTVAALHYLADLGMVGGPVQQTTQGPGGATVTTTVDGSVYNAPAVEAVAVSGQLDGLYDLVDLHVKPLVGLLKESTLDVRTVVKVQRGVWCTCVHLCAFPDMIIPPDINPLIINHRSGAKCPPFSPLPTSPASLKPPPFSLHSVLNPPPLQHLLPPSIPRAPPCISRQSSPTCSTMQDSLVRRWHSSFESIQGLSPWVWRATCSP